jgi:hypothetical protein
MSEGKKRRLWLLEPTFGDLCNCKMHLELVADASFPDGFPDGVRHAGVLSRLPCSPIRS